MNEVQSWKVQSDSCGEKITCGAYSTICSTLTITTQERPWNDSAICVYQPNVHQQSQGK